MSERRTLQVADMIRLDQFLVQVWPELRRQQLRQLLQAGEVLINGQAARQSGQYLHPGAVVEIPMSRPEAPSKPEVVACLPLEVHHEDEALLVVEKPAGMATHSTRGEVGLAQQLRERFPECAHVGGLERAGIVRKMDVEASGLLLVARTEEAYRALKREVKHRLVESRYSVLVEGQLTGEDLIVAPIGNVKATRQRLAVAREGRPARTFYRALRHYREEGQAYTLLEVRPETARLHQIRVHLSWYGYPVVGDRVYGSRHHQSILPDRLFLHLGVLDFPHPVTGEPLHVESALPAALQSILRFMARPKG